MTEPSKYQGTTILETIIAFFIIVGALLVVVQLFHTSLQHGRIIEERLIGASLAERKLEEIRIWASDPDHFEGSWSLYDNQNFTYPGFESFTIRTTLTNPQHPTPNTLLEAAHPVSEQRLLAQSTKGVTVDCTWGPKTNQTIRLASLVAAPPRDWDASPLDIEISGTAPNPLPQDSTATFTVKGYDENHRELEDLTFNWVVVPKGGNGIVASSRRDGKEAAVGNWLYGLGGARIHRPGPVEFSVSARYNGIQRTRFVEVNLQ